MPHDPGQAIDALRRKIEAGDRGGSAADRDALLAFSDRLGLLGSQYTDHRHNKLLRHCTIVAESVGELADALTDREAAEAVVRWIHREYDNPETNRDYRVALRVFGTRLAEADDAIPTDREGVPEALAWVPASTPSSYQPTPDPAAMLTWSDVEALVEAARNPRDRALVAVQFDGGFRGGELHDLTVGDITDTDHGLRAFVDGKTGQRSVTLIPSVPYLKRWLRDHPGDGADAPLWSRLGSAERVSYQRLLQAPKECAERAGVEKPVTPTALRKSNASWLARQGANAGLIEDRQGRTRGSKAVARYVARFGDAADAQYAALHGLEVDTASGAEPANVICPRCEQSTPRAEGRCLHCHAALTHAAAAADRSMDADLIESAAEDPHQADAVMQVHRAMGETPAYRPGFERHD